MSYILRREHRAFWRFLVKIGRVPGAPYIATLTKFLCLRNVEVKLRCGESVRADLLRPEWAKVASRGYHELDTERFMCEYLEPGDVVVDVGAHIGMLSAVAAKRVGPNGKVLAFEPDARNYRDLLRTIRRNGLQNVRAEKVPLGECLEVVRFARPRGAWGAFRRPPSRGTQSGGEEGASDLLRGYSMLDVLLQKFGRIESFSQRMTTFDEYSERHHLGQVDLVKIDVDGPELQVLSGMRRLLSAPDPPALILETSRLSLDFGYSFRELFAYLTGFGYQIFGVPRMTENVVKIEEPADLPTEHSGDLLSTIDLFCYIAPVHQQRWNRLWFSGGSAVKCQ